MLNLNDIKVSDIDIASIENIFGFSFNDEQKDILKCWEAIDIQACPGSGKTTTLAAKLIILAQKLPKTFNRGICIITHTNTAVKEIKTKLGNYAGFYNNYPHHFGTIQSFVDKYLAIPYYKNKYQHAPQIVDNDFMDKKMDARKSYLTTLNFYKYGNIQPGYLSFNIHNFKVSENINFAYEALVKNSRYKKETIESHFNSIKQLKTEIFKDGYFTYDEAYSIAFAYLRKHPGIKQILSKRFPLVFIDEMQDMESHQFKIINDLFNGTGTIIQRIGDINQSIFSSSFSGQSKCEWIPQTTLQLKKSTRLSNHLAAIVSPVCLVPQEMSGWENARPAAPALIVFDDGSKEQVKEKFIELILKHELQKVWTPERPFKAIGLRRSPVSDKHLNLNSYWSEFGKRPGMSGVTEYDNLVSYLHSCSYTAIGTNNVKSCREILLNAFCKSLKLMGIKHPATDKYFTNHSLTNYLVVEKEVEYLRMNKNLSAYTLHRSAMELQKDEIVKYIKSLVAIFGKPLNQALISFCADNDSHFQDFSVNYNQVYQHLGIDVHFDTIHSVKGETHTATLFLETFKDTFDVGGKILDFISSPLKRQRSLRSARSYASWQSKLPSAYVAMSRATHFFSLAVHTDRVNDKMMEYFQDKSNGWQVEVIAGVSNGIVKKI